MGHRALAEFVSSTVLSIGGVGFAAGHPVTVDDLLKMSRISDPQVSPDGTRVLFTVAVPISTRTGSASRRSSWSFQTRDTGC